MSIVKTWSNIRITKTQPQINFHSIPRLDPIDSKYSFLIYETAEHNIHNESYKTRIFSNFQFCVKQFN